VIGGLVLLASLYNVAQDKPQPEVYQAQAMGQGTQMGQNFNITVNIEQYSTDAERQALIDAFNAKGSEGLFNALNKMKSKGQMAITGTLGYSISFARKFQTPDGVKIRVLTNRPIRFGEGWADSRSSDYNLSAVEIVLSPEKGKSTGVLLPACQLIINKKTKELEIENYQNPWKLVNVQDRTSKKK
jgi:hypothetical protein